MITIHEYLSFFTMTTLLLGAAFELPVILMVLAPLCFLYESSIWLIHFLIKASAERN